MGTLFVVATPIGNLDDFSKRACVTLRQSDLILVEDTRQTIKLLNHFDIKVKMKAIINVLIRITGFCGKI